ncbi:MAG: SusC/RagA family TonB-linked outer membrane protein, partial [Ignavibacteria bacterium]|nr:SusC/RagA family TonB-linked outer membrane protein [Ignavibacteria bacterium]
LSEFNFRADASSRFRKGKRWGYFPSASIGWRLSEESFLLDSFFDELKIRASYGELGNQNLNSYWPYLTVITQNNETSYNVGNALTPGAAVTTLVDENITWETTTSFDLGIDLRVFNDRLSAEFDYFVKNTKDILVQLPIPSLLGGVTAPYENVGEMKNTGFEFSFNWRDRMDNGLSYNLGTNITFVENEVVKFREDSPDQLYLIREGYSYKTLYGYTFEGIFQSDEEASAHMHANGFKPKAGDVKYIDRNSDGKLDYNDKTELGNTIPKITYGVNGSISYKGFDLSMLLQGIAKVHVYTKNAFTEQPWTYSGGAATVRWRDAWTPTNPSTTVPRIIPGDSWNGQASSYWVNELSWLKLKNIQLGYTLPKKWTSFASIKSANFYINGQNVLTYVNDKYEGFDPERDTFGNGYYHYPVPRIYSVGINVKF